MSIGPADFGFDLLPPDSGVLNPDLALDAALQPVVNLGTPDEIPLGRGWQFDFAAGEFVMAGPSPAGVSDEDHLRVWIEKTLRTARFAHAIYTDAYGMVEPNQLIGTPYGAEVVGAYQEAIVDALTAHDRIAAVDAFFFQRDPYQDVLYVSFTVTLDAVAEQALQVSPLPLNVSSS